MTKQQFADLIASTPAGEPLFDSLEEMCEALGFDNETQERMRRDMEFTATLAPETLQ